MWVTFTSMLFTICTFLKQCTGSQSYSPPVSGSPLVAKILATFIHSYVAKILAGFLHIFVAKMVAAFLQFCCEDGGSISSHLGGEYGPLVLAVSKEPGHPDAGRLEASGLQQLPGAQHLGHRLSLDIFQGKGGSDPNPNLLRNFCLLEMRPKIQGGKVVQAVQQNSKVELL
mgnify:CR=1 FL=1